jgi:glycosyltransferase involved in cell wall biosynthesis
MRILMSAYSCEPGVGSERGVGWHVAIEAAKYHQVWVLTRPDESKQAIEAELESHPVPNLHFVYFTLPFWQDSLRWGQSGAMQIHYYLWQIQAYFVARELHRKLDFDVIHHVTFVKYSSPSFLALLPIPFVWGPVGGGESAPMSFWADFSSKNKLYETLRWLSRSIGELDPFARQTAQRSAIAYVTTEDTAIRVRQMGAPSVEIAPETGMSSQDLEQLARCPPPTASPVRFIGIARLLHWKGFQLGLRAFALANLPNAEYWILGEGPELERLEALALELGITDQVIFWGLQSRAEVLLKLGQCSALVHPSLHDSGGWVCLEAMAAGRPVICLDLGGPAQQVTAETGFKVPAHHPEQTVAALAEAMNQIAASEDLRLQMGKAGQQRVRNYYSWEARGKYLAKTYAALTSERKASQEIV